MSLPSSRSSTPPPLALRLLVVGASALGVACTGTETVVREVIVAGDAAAASNALGEMTASDASDEPSAAGAFADAAAEDLPFFDGTPGVSVADTVNGDPGVPVDCAGTLPCRWLSEDGGFALTVTSGDEMGARGGFSVAFRVDTLHDTELVFGSGSEALDALGSSHSPVARTLGAGNGIAAFGLRAGEPLTGRIDYADVVDADRLARWRVGLVDNGVVREATFANLPLGPAASEHADCALALPCTWTSGDGATSVTLLSSGGLSDARRLSVGFSVLTDTDLALDGATALGVDATRFVSRNHALGTTTGFETITARSVTGLELGGTVDFRRTPTTGRALASLTLELYPDAPVPRWDVVFENVPLP